MGNSLRSACNRRNLTLVAAFMAVAVVAAVSLPASLDAQQTRCGTEISYFDNWGNQIGMRSWAPWECGCYYNEWGVTSGNRTFSDSWC